MEKNYHYTYKLTHIETGEFYYGVRSCNCHPSYDNYMGSMKTWKPDKSKLIKEIIELFNTRKEANLGEEKLISKYIKDELNRNYFCFPNFHNYGIKHTEESKKKMSIFRKEIKLSEETKKKISEAGKGRKHSEESKKKISKKLTGKKHTEESKKKMSELAKGRVSPNKGKKMSEEQKKKISESNKLFHKQKLEANNQSSTY